MNTFSKILKNASFILVFFIAASGCKKTTQPALGDYPKDANPPGGPLKFYVAFDGTSTNPLMNAVDSTRANFPATNTGAVADGISGKSYKGSETAIAKYAGVNDFGKSTSFTIAFWIKKTPQASGKGTNFAFSMDKKDYSWTNTKLFLEFEDWSTTSVGNCKLYIMDQWTEYINGNGMPNVLNGNWHHLAFTYNGTNSTLVAYIDGTMFRTNTLSTPSPLKDGFGDYDDFVIGGLSDYTHSKNTWMNNWDGSIDQFRLYGTALTAAEVSALYASKL
ncbi:LamG domain-containing protein [Ferruginibacter sp. SUN106]|uniref:LamG domain-containing protein n=1 Tax=Ferruginibacter sp. SUN106 TaxID=2978348 RepID=UPI003D362E3D